MRTIKFRGKRVDNGEWVYGYLYVGQNDYYIMEIVKSGFQSHKVVPETIGQFTGLTDKNEKEIYEGDVVFIEYIDFDYSEDGTCYIKTVVEYETERMRFNFSNYGKSVINTYKSCLEVIGNIHDNPELLGERK